MFASSSTGGAVLPRPTYPDSPRIVQAADRRTREVADIMLRLNAENPDGCTETTLLLEGVSMHEQRELGAVARLLANKQFVRQDCEQVAPPTDDDLIAEALSLHDPLFRRLVIKLRARPEFNEDVLARLWPRIVTRLAAKLAKAAMPPRLDATGGRS